MIDVDVYIFVCDRTKSLNNPLVINCLKNFFFDKNNNNPYL